MPNFPNVPPPAGSWSSADPGFIPLRPLTTGDIIGGGLAVVRRHIRLLGPIALAVSVLSSAVDLAILWSSGSMESVATGAWLTDVRSTLSGGRLDALPTGVYLSTTLSTLVSIVGTLVLSAVAVACVAADAVGRRPDSGAVAGRLRGRLGAAAVASLAVGVAILVGSFLLVVPAVAAFTAWGVAAPVAVMEGAGPGAALARSARLTRGHRWRLLGVMLLIVIIAVAIEAVIANVIVGLVPNLSAVGGLVVGDIVTALVSAVTGSWTGAVLALLYVDIRLRTENLGQALRAHAARLGRG